MIIDFRESVKCRDYAVNKQSCANDVQYANFSSKMVLRHRFIGISSSFYFVGLIPPLSIQRQHPVFERRLANHAAIRNRDRPPGRIGPPRAPSHRPGKSCFRQLHVRIVVEDHVAHLSLATIGVKRHLHRCAAPFGEKDYLTLSERRFPDFSPVLPNHLILWRCRPSVEDI